MYLYAVENFTQFRLVYNDSWGKSTTITEDYKDETIDTVIELRCAKCDKQLTKEEYDNNKIHRVKNDRKIMARSCKYSESSGEDMVRYEWEHNRCTK